MADDIPQYLREGSSDATATKKSIPSYLKSDTDKPNQGIPGYLSSRDSNAQFGNAIPETPGQETAAQAVMRGVNLPFDAAEKALLKEASMVPRAIFEVFKPRTPLGPREKLNSLLGLQEKERPEGPPTLSQGAVQTSGQPFETPEQSVSTPATSAASGFVGTPLEETQKPGRIPLTVRKIGRGVIDFLYPQSIADWAFYLYPPLRILGGKVISGMAEKTSAEAMRIALTGDEAAMRRLSEGFLEDLNQINSGIKSGMLKKLQAPTARETAVNMLQRKANGFELSAEAGGLKLKQVVPFVKATAEEAARNVLKGVPLKLEEGVQLTDSVVKAYKTGELDATVAAKFLNRPELVRELEVMDPAARETVGRILRQSVSASAYQLGAMGNLAKQINKVRLIDSKVAAMFDLAGDMEGKSNVYQSIRNIYRYGIQAWRANISAGFGLTMRNTLMHAVKFSSNLIDDAMSGVEGALTGRIPKSEAFASAYQDYMSALHNLTPRGWQEFKAMVTKIEKLAPLTGAKIRQNILGSPIGDVALGDKLAKIINPLDRINYRFFNQSAIDAEIRNIARLKGVPINKLTEADFSRALEHSQNMTFSSNFSNVKFANDYFRLYTNHPWMYMLGQTFPRIWANIVKNVYEYSPLPLFSEKTYANLASRDPKIAFSAFNKVFQGRVLQGLGYYLGANGYFPGKWYNLTVGKTQTDLRRDHPFAMNVFMGAVQGKAIQRYADAMKQGKSEDAAMQDALSPLGELSSNDVLQMTLSLKRTDLSGLPVLDLFDLSQGKSWPEKIEGVLSSWISGAVPWVLKSGMDVWSHYDREYQIPRAIKEMPLTGPARSRIPFSSERIKKALGEKVASILPKPLPTQYSPLRSGPELYESPILHLLSGQVTRRRTDAELEADRLNLKYTDIYPHTGNPMVDNLIMMYSGPHIEESLNGLMASPAYMRLNDERKSFIFKKVIHKFQRSMQYRAVGDLTPLEAAEQVLKFKKKLQKDIMRGELEKIDIGLPEDNQ